MPNVNCCIALAISQLTLTKYTKTKSEYTISLYRCALDKETQITTKLSVKSKNFVEYRQNRRIPNIIFALPELAFNIST